MNVSREGRLDLSDVKYVSAEHALRVRIGDVLFNNTNSPALVGKTAFVSTDADLAFSNHMTRLRPPAGVSGRFVAHQLHFMWMTGYFRSRCTNHVNQASISSTTLSGSVPIAMAPAAEQARICDEVEKQFTRLDAAVAGLQRVKANLKRYRASVLKAACEGRLVPTEAELARRDGRSFESGEELLKRILKERRTRWEVDQLAKMEAAGKAPRNDQWKRQYEEPLRPATAEGDPTPAEWGVASLDELTVFGPQNGLYKPQGNYGSGVPIIRIDDYQDWTHKTRNELRQVEVTDGESLDYAIRGSDLLINRVNSPSHLGKCLLCPADFTGALFESNMMRLRLTELTCPQFVSVYLRSHGGRRRLTSGAKWAVNQASINQKDVGVCPVPLPPLPEQHRIVAEVERRLSVVDELDATVEKNLARCARLRQSILKMAFEGRFVPQDPNDEPASVLLERIRSSRAAGAISATSPSARSPRGRKRAKNP